MTTRRSRRRVRENSRSRSPPGRLGQTNGYDGAHGRFNRQKPCAGKCVLRRCVQRFLRRLHGPLREHPRRNSRSGVGKSMGMWVGRSRGSSTLVPPINLNSLLERTPLWEPALVLNEIDILRDVAIRLERAHLAYMLTGSMALNYYAEPRMTRDIDIVVSVSSADTRRIIEVFTPDYYISSEAVEGSIRDESMFNAIHLESVIKVDCIVQKSTPYRRTEFERRKRIRIHDFEVWITTREDLIISKLHWARDSQSELQFRDVKNLGVENLDSPYLNHWTEQLGLSDIWKRLHE